MCARDYQRSRRSTVLALILCQPGCLHDISVVATWIIHASEFELAGEEQGKRSFSVPRGR